VVGNGTATPLEDGSIQLETSELALWEIPFDHRAERFRLQVEVDDLAPRTTGLGLYFGYSALETIEGREHWFYEHSFAERPPEVRDPDTLDGLAQAQVRARRFGTGLERVGRIDHAMIPTRERNTVAFPPTRGTNRLLIVDVTPDLVCAYWRKDKAPFTHIPATLLKLHGSELGRQEPKRKNAPPLFHPVRGGVGLVCENGSALFRRLAITPLPGNE
jgi:hypothetical protein